jgi:hypothetical protein
MESVFNCQEESEGVDYIMRRNNVLVVIKTGTYPMDNVYKLHLINSKKIVSII